MKEVTLAIDIPRATNKIINVRCTTEFIMGGIEDKLDCVFDVINMVTSLGII